MNALKKELTKPFSISTVVSGRDIRDSREVVSFSSILDSQTEIDQKIVAKDKARAGEILRDVMRTICANSVYYVE